MQRIHKFFSKNILIVLLLLIIPSFVSLIRVGFYSMHDDLQAFRIFEMDKCIVDLQIPCRWIPDMGYGYGYPQFNYYPPSAYYLGEIFHLIGFQFIDATKLLFIFGFVASAFSMYLFLKDWLSKFPALFGALLYTYAPYKAVDVYVRGAMSEFMALIFFPLIFWAILKLVKTGKTRYVVYLGLSTGLLLITHNLMPLIFLPVAAIWTITLVVLEKSWRILPKIILGVLLGVGLAAFFSLPVAFERQYAHIESIVGGYFDYRMHFVDVRQLFLSNYWGYGSSVWGPYDEMSLSTGQIHALMGVLALVLALMNFKRNRKLSTLTIILFITTLGILFMMHQKSSPIWSALPFMTFLQFPWRFLGDSVFLLSVLAALSIHFILQMDSSFFKKIRLGYFFASFVILGVLALHLGFFQPHAWVNISDKDKFSGKSWDKQLTISIFDYLPIYAKLPPTSLAPEKPEVLEGVANFESYKKGSDFQYGNVSVSKEALLRLPLFDFPGMKVMVDDKQVFHWHDDCRGQEYCLGLITFKVSEGAHFIKTELTDTPVRSVGNLITLFSIIVVGVFLVKLRRR